MKGARANDDPPSPKIGSLWQELTAPLPGRAANTLRLAAIALIIIAICEAFRVPNGATAAYMAFIIFKSDADATIPLAIVAVCAILFGILISIVYFAATLSEPALRIPLMAVISFGAAYLSRASTLGVPAFVAGLFTVVSLEKGDDLLSGDLSPYNNSDVEGPGLPSLAYMPPEEALVHNLLWLALAVTLAFLVIVVVDRLTMPDPERKLRQALAERLSAMASLCAGDAEARQRVVAFARTGTAALSAQNTVAGKLTGGRFRPAFGEAVIRTMTTLALLLLAARRLPSQDAASELLQRAGPILSEAAAVTRRGPGTPMRTERSAAEAGWKDTSGFRVNGADAATTALAAQLAPALDALIEAVNDRTPDRDVKVGAGFLKPDAFTNVAYRRYALKVTLAVMACYLFMNLADWSSISTCITTAFVVSLDGVGQSVHKMILRVSGALIGAAAGFLCILFVMPAMTDLGQLLCVMAPMILAGAWIRTGGARVSYFGQQMAFAFMLVVLQDYGPTLHFQTGRDRVIGILVGEIAVVVVFLHVWPVTVGILVRQGMAAALHELAVAMAPGERQARAASVQNFVEAIVRAQGLLADDRFEPGIATQHGSVPTVDGDLLLRVQSLAVPAAILASQEGNTADREADDSERYAAETSVWLSRFETWIESGTGGEHLSTTLPRPPNLADAGNAATSALWCRVIDADLREILGMPSPSISGEPRLAPQSSG